MDNQILERAELEENCRLLRKIKEQIESVFIGKDEAVELALNAFLAQGHVLLEDLPGTGKTTLAKAIAKTIGCKFNRIQFTPDLMPSDVTGMNYYNIKTGEFEFRPGPIITNVLLADELNRATPRTQSALLEAMEEKQVTIDGVTHSLQQPFIVLATQNPIETEGTFPLPFAQQDRFLMKIKLGYPQKAKEIKILEKHAFGNILEELKPALDLIMAKSVQHTIQHIFMDKTLIQYILDLVTATRQNEAIELPLSPRASIHMVRAAKARAILQSRDYVLPDDIKYLCLPVFSHRLKLKREEQYKDINPDALLREILKKVPLPAITINQ